MKKLVTLFFTILIIIVGVVISNLLSNQKQPMRRRPNSNTVRPVKVITVNNRDIHTTRKIGGYLNALDKAEIFAEVSGVLLETPKRFKEGNRFKKGAVLIHIDDAVYRNNVLAKKSSLLNQLTLLLPDLSIDFPESAKRWQGYLQQFDLDKSLTGLPKPISDQEKYYIASRNIYNQYYAIKSMEETLDKYTIEAPYNGVVTMSNINPGTLVRMGQKLGEFTNTDTYELEAFAGVKDVQFLKIGDPVILTSEDTPDRFSGKIKRINDVIDRKSQTVKVYITTTDSRLKDGMYLTAEVTSELIENATRIDRKLIVGTNQLFTLAEDSTLKLRTVQIAGEENDIVIVQGLANGMKVIAQNLANAQEGRKIEKIALN